MPIDRYQVNDGDTLQQIARRELGHADQWWILASFNKLDYPFIDTTGAVHQGKTVLGLGGILLIPKDLDDSSVKRAVIQTEPDQHQLIFGVDMALSDDGDLLADFATGDWQAVIGVENLVGALRRRLMTRSGLYPFHPEYGGDLERYVGQASDPVAVTGVRLEVMQTALREPRIQAVTKVGLVADAEHVDVSLLCKTIGSDSVTPLNIVIQR